MDTIVSLGHPKQPRAIESFRESEELYKLSDYATT